MEQPRLEVDIYQIVDDGLMKCNRSDGTGWDWCWADWQRDWMNATPNRYAYRCLPLTIVNQTGWWIKNPIGFSATWHGSTAAGSIAFDFDVDGDFWKDWINSQFGEGIVTWNTPFLFRTRPKGSRLLICGPANSFKANAHPLTALIESDWMSMSFTMNWKLMEPHVPVRFEVGEPLFQAIPLISNACADLEGASVSYQRLSDDPEMTTAYNDWHHARRDFHERKARGDVKPDDWQKDYFQGRDMSGREAAPDHMTKVKPPHVRNGNLSSPTKLVAKPIAKPQERAPAKQQPKNFSANVVASTSTIVARKVDDDWRRWIAENLMLDVTPESILNTMIASGFPRDESVSEINLALQSPYVMGSETLRNRLKKRDWLLATYRKLDRMDPGSGVIERRANLSRAEFFAEYYRVNRPVIITGMIDDWPALRKWSLDYLSKAFGDREIEVQFGRNAGGNYEIEREKYLKKLRFADFIAMVRASGVTNDFYLTANNNSNNKQVLPELWDDIVQIPEYLDDSDRMGGFFWMGPAGTITPFHHDLTNNFMAQVIGRKRVKIAPSWDIPLMANDLHVFSKVDGRVTPARPHAQPTEPQILECILGPGEVLFLPIGCLHYVEGIDISVTVSFTNFVFDNDFSSFYTTYQRV